MAVIPFVFSVASSFADNETALAALGALPNGELSRLSALVGCDGTPEPAAWHFLVYDPSAENGLREYVVSNHQIQARREFSQFASELKSTDVIGKEWPHIDSDLAGTLARQYAAASGMEVVSINYELRRHEQSGRPVWTVTCRDAEGKTRGWLVIDAQTGNAVQQNGFNVALADYSPDEKAPSAQLDQSSEAGRKKSSKTRRSDEIRSQRTRTPPEPVAESNREKNTEVRRAVPVQSRPSAAERTTRAIRRLFPF